MVMFRQNKTICFSTSYLCVNTRPEGGQTLPCVTKHKAQGHTSLRFDSNLWLL